MARYGESSDTPAAPSSDKLANHSRRRPAGKQLVEYLDTKSISPVGEDTPKRRASLYHGRFLFQALRLFDSTIMDGGSVKAVINGPVSVP